MICCSTKFVHTRVIRVLHQCEVSYKLMPLTFTLYHAYGILRGEVGNRMIAHSLRGVVQA